MHTRRDRACTSPSRVTASLLLSFLAVSSAAELPILTPPLTSPSAIDATKEFSLKHVFHHGTYRYPDLHRRRDVPERAIVWMAGDQDGVGEPVPQLRVRSEATNIQRLVDRSKETMESILAWGQKTGRAASLSAADWTIDDIAGPNVSDKETVLSFARMASDAYILEPDTGDWEDVGGGFNYTEDFGWQADGLRGHVFADPTNSTVVIGLKGTSPALFDGEETTSNDKLNDNLFFSCCCGQGGQFLWKQVCDCQTSVYTCDSTCLVKALRNKNRYYTAAQNLYHNVTALYPDAEVWMAGHSLGGSVASFLSLTYGHPAVTFEAVPDAMPASRLGLPVPPGHEVGSLQHRQMTGGYHFGHTADPVYMGSCNQASSICTLGGYAMESVCHTGKKCVYDTVKDFGWRVGIGTHKILGVIKDVIQKYDEPAKCEEYVDCTDCFPWQYRKNNGSGTTTSSVLSTSTATKSRTETCKTPGWFGCLDETTTSGPSTTTSKASPSPSTTSTCKTPGWFGCLDDDETTTTAATASPAPAPSATTTRASTTCETEGWFGGCLDATAPPSTSRRPTPRPTPRPTSGLSSSVSTTCTSEGWFGLICYDGSGSRKPSSAGYPSHEQMEV